MSRRRLSLIVGAVFLVASSYIYATNVSHAVWAAILAFIGLLILFWK